MAKSRPKKVKVGFRVAMASQPFRSSTGVTTANSTNKIQMQISWVGRSTSALVQVLYIALETLLYIKALSGHLWADNWSLQCPHCWLNLLVDLFYSIYIELALLLNMGIEYIALLYQLAFVYLCKTKPNRTLYIKGKVDFFSILSNWFPTFVPPMA